MDLNHTRLPIPPPEHNSLFAINFSADMSFNICHISDFANQKTIFFEFFLQKCTFSTFISLKNCFQPIFKTVVSQQRLP